jgi:hypothetical protein
MNRRRKERSRTRRWRNNRKRKIKERSWTRKRIIRKWGKNRKIMKTQRKLCLIPWVWKFYTVSSANCVHLILNLLCSKALS